MNMITPKNLKRSGDTSEALFLRLVEDIVTGVLEAGEPLREAHLATLWGVSRTPVREAVRRAAAMGLVELRPNQRPLVRRLTADDVAKLLAVRTALELLAYDLAVASLKGSCQVEALWLEADSLGKATARPAWKRRAVALDESLHRLWIDACNNTWLQLALGSLWTFIRILQRIVARDTQLAVVACKEHHAILSAVRSGDFLAGRKLLAAHIQSAGNMLKKRLEQR